MLYEVITRSGPTGAAPSTTPKAPMNAATALKPLAIAALGLLLGACQSLAPSHRPAAYQRTTWEHTQSGCQHDFV